jgi:ribosome-binding ATPase YchF (GTP1/OBG family)
MVPIAEHQALGIAVISYDGRLDFGINGDWDALSDIELLGEDLRSSLAELMQAATARPKRKAKTASAKRPSKQAS